MTEVQIENTLSKTVSDLLCDPSMRATQINISNLTSYIQAIVLFDKVILPARPNREHAPTEIIPEPLDKADVFMVDVVNDFADRMKKAQDQALELAAKSTQPRVMPSDTTYKTTTKHLLVNYIHETLTRQGVGWHKAFWSDIKGIMKGGGNYEKEGVGKVLEHFKEPAYAKLSPEEKIGIYYLWRCFYNVELAVDRDRVYLANLARSPLVGPAFEALRAKVVRAPLLSDIPIDLKSWIIENMSPGSPPQFWVRTLPTLLHTVLKSAHKERKRVAHAILDLRNSPSAVAFRKHFGEIRTKTSTSGMMQIMRDDIERLLDLWSGLSDVGREPGSIIKPFVKGFEGAMEIPAMIWKIPFFAVRCRHLRIFWQNPLTKGTLNRELAGRIENTFGGPVTRLDDLL